MDFKANDRVMCSVGFYNPTCEGVLGNFDSKSAFLDAKNQTYSVNAETVTFKGIIPSIYLVYVGEYLDKVSLEKP